MLAFSNRIALSVLIPLSVAQYVPICSKQVTNMDAASASKAGCQTVVGSNQTLTVYSTADCSDKGWPLGPLSYDTSTPSQYAFQSVKLSREALSSESILFFSLGSTARTYWHMSSNPLQALYGSFPSYCGTNEADLTSQGVAPSGTDGSTCIPLVEKSNLTCAMITLIGICPDDRADWPVMPNCGDKNASSTNCATQTSVTSVLPLNNVTIAGAVVRTWNTSSAWSARASSEISILKAHGALNTSASSPMGPVNTPLNRPGNGQSGTSLSMTGDAAVKANAGGGVNNNTSGDTGFHATSYTDAPSLLPSFTSATGGLMSTDPAYTDIQAIPDGNKAIAQSGSAGSQTAQGATMATNGPYANTTSSSANVDASSECSAYAGSDYLDDENIGDGDDGDDNELDNLDDEYLDDSDEEEIILIVPVEE